MRVSVVVISAGCAKGKAREKKKFLAPPKMGGGGKEASRGLV